MSNEDKFRLASFIVGAGLLVIALIMFGLFFNSQ